jgi:hypothetical protein
MNRLLNVDVVKECSAACCGNDASSEERRIFLGCIKSDRNVKRLSSKY